MKVCAIFKYRNWNIYNLRIGTYNLSYLIYLIHENIMCIIIVTYNSCQKNDKQALMN